MADLDTAAKRISGINPRSPWRALFPLPDSTIDQGDRQSIAYLYSGINAAAVGGISVPIAYRQRQMQGMAS